MFHKETDYIAIALTSESLKVAQLRLSGGKTKLINTAYKSLAQIPPEQFVKEIRSILTKFKFKKATVVCVVPSSVSTTKSIEIPSIDPEEIRSIVNLQAGRHTPYSREEILIGFTKIGVYQTNYTKVLLVIVNRSAVTQQLDVLDRAGIHVDHVFFAPEGMARFYANVLKLGNDNPPVGIIDVNQTSTDFIIDLRGTIITCRNIPIGKQHLVQDPASAQEKLVQELKNSVEVYQSEDIDRLPECYVLTSPDEMLSTLAVRLKNELKADVKTVSLVDHLSIGQGLKDKINEAGKTDSLLGVIASIAGGESQMDLIPEKVKVQRSFKEHSRHIIQSGVLAFVILVLICVSVFTKLYFKEKFLERLNANYNGQQEEVQMLKTTSVETRIVRDFLGQRMVSLDTLDALYSILPEEVYLSSISLDEKGNVSIQGTSDSMSLVFSLVTALEESEYFKSVKTKSTAAKKDKGKDVASFEIVLKLTNAKNDEDSGEPVVESASEE